MRAFADFGSRTIFCGPLWTVCEPSPPQAENPCSRASFASCSWLSLAAFAAKREKGAGFGARASFPGAVQGRVGAEVFQTPPFAGGFISCALPPLLLWRGISLSLPFFTVSAGRASATLEQILERVIFYPNPI